MSGRWAWADVDLSAVRHNIGVLRRVVAPAEVWAVVKADGYGHGVEAIARAALDAGATGLCVALAQEGVALRDAGVTAPVLVLSEQPVGDIPTIVEWFLTPTAYSSTFVDLLAAEWERTSTEVRAIHVNVDTGMQRVGVGSGDVTTFLRYVATTHPAVTVDGIFTHLAMADEPDAPANGEQLDRFDTVLGRLDAAGLRPRVVHAANSAAALALPRARFDLVRAGIAVYGVSPGPGVDHLVGDLRPALSLRARVSYVKPVRAGTHVSYGWRHRFEIDTTVATVPIGYADGVPRRLGTLPDRPGFHVLIGGTPFPIVGVVTMDQLMVDVGEATVVVGDEVVLLGAQGDRRIRPEDWAERLGTIGYEIVCGIGARITRRYVD